MIDENNETQKRDYRTTVDLGFGPMASLVLDAGGLGHQAGGLPPPLTLPAPTSLVCPHLPRLPPC